MFRWIKNNVVDCRVPDRPKERSDQSVWIKKAMREWQLRWHDIFDGDRDVVAADGFARPDPLPDEVNCDFRLIFGLSRATAQTRQACFDLFPSGTEMHKRFEHFLSSKPSPFGEAEAKARLAAVIASIEALAPNEDVDLSRVRVVDCDTKEGLAALSNTDDVTILFEQNAMSPYPVEDLEKVAALLFLTEPLYAAAGNSYHVSNWVTAAMTGGRTDELHFELYELWMGGWQVALGSDGLIIASQRV